MAALGAGIPASTAVMTVLATSVAIGVLPASAATGPVREHLVPQQRALCAPRLHLATDRRRRPPTRH